jgi:ADP-L-glycero-D-manno-heptose 6-epimerase
MIVITGAAGFIGSQLAKTLREKYSSRIAIVDNFTMKNHDNWPSSYDYTLSPSAFPSWLIRYSQEIEVVIHLGAVTDTMATDRDFVYAHNTEFSKAVWILCTHYKIPLIYASSAATYGDGSLGYSDDHNLVPSLKPLNLYAESKQDFDLFALNNGGPPHWYGLKFFNVYGWNERPKGKMASVIFHAKKQIEETGKLNLFKSYREDFQDGQQMRDFVYVKDVVEVIDWLRTHRPESGIYNVGTGEARSFNDLAQCVFKELETELNVEYIEMPEELKDKYQYFTEADISKLRSVGCNLKFHTLEEGIHDYIKQLKWVDSINASAAATYSNMSTTRKKTSTT